MEGCRVGVERVEDGTVEGEGESIVSRIVSCWDLPPLIFCPKDRK